jgi:hypothetical protein
VICFDYKIQIDLIDALQQNKIYDVYEQATLNNVTAVGVVPFHVNSRKFTRVLGDG